MGTRQRIRRVFDRGRFGQLAQQPGIDTRSWIVLGRVDDDDDAIRWSGAEGDDGPLGWIVDVTIQGGDLDQEDGVPCRLGAAYARDGEIRSDPPARGCLVLVALPSGNLNTEPTIIGELPTDGCAPPSQVNGTDIDSDYALATHIFVTSLAVDQEVAGDRRVQTGEGSTHRILGEAVELADEGAEQPFVRGTAYADAESDFLDALDTFAQAVNTGITSASATDLGGVTITPAVTALAQAVAAFKAARNDYLSTKITGD